MQSSHLETVGLSWSGFHSPVGGSGAGLGPEVIVPRYHCPGSGDCFSLASGDKHYSQSCVRPADRLPGFKRCPHTHAQSTSHGLCGSAGAPSMQGLLPAHLRCLDLHRPPGTGLCSSPRAPAWTVSGSKRGHHRAPPVCPLDSRDHFTHCVRSVGLLQSAG